MVYRNPYQGYSDQDYGYTTDDDHMKGHYGRYNGTGQYGQEEYIHQNGYSTQVYINISPHHRIENNQRLCMISTILLSLLLISRHRGPVIALTMNLSP